MHRHHLNAVGAALIVCLTAHAGAIEIAVDECGTVERFPTCTYFRPNAGGGWYFPPILGSPAVGQHGRLIGVVETGCMVTCPVAQGCIVSYTFVPTCEQPPRCPADFDGSGTLGVQDLFDFLNAYFGGGLGPSPPGGDFDQSGTISVQDIFEFLESWFGGCP